MSSLKRSVGIFLLCSHLARLQTYIKLSCVLLLFMEEFWNLKTRLLIRGASWRAIIFTMILLMMWIRLMNLYSVIFALILLRQEHNIRGVEPKYPGCVQDIELEDCSHNVLFMISSFEESPSETVWGWGPFDTHLVKSCSYFLECEGVNQFLLRQYY